MITLGSVEWGSSPTIGITFEYEHQRSGADMQYRVKATINPLTGERYFGYPINLQLTLNGASVLTQQLKAASPSQWSSAITYTSNWFTVTNKTDGTTTCSFRIYSGSGSSRNVTYSYALAVDPAGSTITASDGTLGVQQTISLTRYSASFTDTISWECGSSSGTIATQSSATSFSWTPAVALAAENTDGSSVIVTLICQTYDGNTLIQERTFSVSETIPASVKPSVSLAVSDHNNLVSTYGAYVQGQSALDIVVTPSLAYGSPIASYAITADGRQYTATPTTTPVLSGSGTLAVTAKATDRRGRASDTASQNITVLPWAVPTISNVNSVRCTSSGTEDPEGAYMLVTFDAVIAALGNHNSAAYVLQYRQSGAASWASVTLTDYAEQYTVTGGQVIVAADVSYSFDAQIVATDDFASTTFPASGVGIAFDLMDFRASGKGITFGRVATEDGFVSAMPTTFEDDVQVDGDLNIDGDLTVNGQPIQTTVDLETDVTGILPIVNGGTGYAGVETLSVTATRSSGSSSVQSCTAYRFGKVVHLYLLIRTSASISAGSVIFEGSINGHYPLTGVSTTAFSGSYVSVGLLRDTGTITIRETIGTIPTNYNIGFCFTYIEAA